MTADEQASDLASEFPGWEAWQSIDWLWHARIRRVTPPVMVHSADLAGLRDQIVAYQGHAGTVSR